MRLDHLMAAVRADPSPELLAELCRRAEVMLAALQLQRSCEERADVEFYADQAEAMAPAWRAVAAAIEAANGE